MLPQFLNSGLEKYEGKLQNIYLECDEKWIK